jgi:hypothetical protein
MNADDGTVSAADSGDPNGWDGVRFEVDRILARSSDPFDPRTIANVQDLLTACQNECPVPMTVAKGYWNTVCFCWRKFEIEVLENRLEIYRFEDQRTSIWYEEHSPGETFSPQFIAELTALSLQIEE